MATGDIVVRLLGDTKDFEKKFNGLSGRLSGLGNSLTRTLTPAAAALGVGFRHAFNEFDTGADALRVGTGKTGKALKALESSAKSVAGTVTQGFGQVGSVMADLSKRTDLTGKPLEQLTKKVLDLARISGGDAQASVASLTRVFGDWSVKTDDQAATMDRLFRAGQASGSTVERLSELMVQFGSPLRQLGLDFDTTAAMFARFEKEGVNIQTALPGLRMALKKFAKDGKEPGAALQDMIEKIKNTASTAEANKMAFETFGVRAGPDLAAAIREGRFELDEYITAMQTGSDTIDKAATDTLDWSDKLSMLKNKVVGVVGPVGELGMAAAGIGAGLGPTLSGLGKMGDLLKRLARRILGTSAATTTFATTTATSMNTAAVSTTVASGKMVAAFTAIKAAAGIAAAAIAGYEVGKIIEEKWVRPVIAAIERANDHTATQVESMKNRFVEQFHAMGFGGSRELMPVVRVLNEIDSQGKLTGESMFRVYEQLRLIGKAASLGYDTSRAIRDIAKGGGAAEDAIARLDKAIRDLERGVNVPINFISGGGAADLVLANVPQFHTGGTFRAPTSGGEGLALLQDRERVLTPGQWGRMGGRGTIIIVQPGAFVLHGDPESNARAVAKAFNKMAGRGVRVLSDDVLRRAG